MSDNSETSNSKHLPISENVMVLEKEFKSKRSHCGNITCMRKISDSEFMTSSEDMSFKVWDKDLQGCSYTYETHDQIHNMSMTGEKDDLLISALGNGNFLVLGLDQKNQNDIIEGAHEEKIVQIVTLKKLSGKYFATRCVDGDLSIWSANTHPDKVFDIQNIDAPDTQANNDAPIESELNETIEDQKNEEAEEEEVDEDGSPISPKKKKKAPPPVKKPKGIRISSDKDQMIEIMRERNYIIPNSATLLAFSNYKESFVNIALIDLKTRRKHINMKFEISNKPTKLFQIDETELLVGTEGGKIEHWSFTDGKCKKIYDAHPESDAGISAILELQTKSHLLRGEPWVEKE